VENLFLVTLRRLDEKLDRVIADVHDLKVRMTSVEERLARLQLDIADVRLESPASTAASTAWISGSTASSGVWIS
jgi:hypothetical protein